MTKQSRPPGRLHQEFDFDEFAVGKESTRAFPTGMPMWAPDFGGEFRVGAACEDFETVGEGHVGSVGGFDGGDRAGGGGEAAGGGVHFYRVHSRSLARVLNRFSNPGSTMVPALMRWPAQCGNGQRSQENGSMTVSCPMAAPEFNPGIFGGEEGDAVGHVEGLDSFLHNSGDIREFAASVDGEDVFGGDGGDGFQFFTHAFEDGEGVGEVVLAFFVVGLDVGEGVEEVAGAEHPVGGVHFFDLALARVWRRCVRRCR